MTDTKYTMNTDSHLTAHKISKEATNTINQRKLMEWTIKALPKNTFHMDIGMAIMTLLGLIAVANGLYENYILNLQEADQSVFLSLRFGTAMTLMSIYLWALVVRQKKIYHYTITESFGTQESKLHFPKIAGTTFKTISVAFLIFIVGLAIFEKSLILMIAGPAGMAVVAAKFFLSWDNTPQIETTSNWKKYKFVTVDRKRKIIVAHQTSKMVGFEARLPKEIFDQYLSTLHTLLPQDAIFTEAEWKW